MNTTVASVTLPEKYVRHPSNNTMMVNPEYAALWESYLDEGMPYSRVAEIFGVHRNVVAKYYPGRGWTRKQCVELGTFMKHHNEKMRKSTFGK